MPAAEEIVAAVIERLARSAWFTARCPGCRRRLLDYRSDIVEGVAHVDRICPECHHTVRLSLGGESLTE